MRTRGLARESGPVPPSSSARPTRDRRAAPCAAVRADRGVVDEVGTGSHSEPDDRALRPRRAWCTRRGSVDLGLVAELKPGDEFRPDAFQERPRFGPRDVALSASRLMPRIRCARRARAVARVTASHRGVSAYLTPGGLDSRCRPPGPVRRITAETDDGRPIWVELPDEPDEGWIRRRRVVPE